MEVVKIVLRVADWDLRWTGVQTIVAKITERNSKYLHVLTAWENSKQIEVGLALIAQDWWSGEKLSISKLQLQAVKLSCLRVGFSDIWYFAGKKSFLPHDSNTWGVKS